MNLIVKNANKKIQSNFEYKRGMTKRIVYYDTFFERE